jgi:low temperature requirement protein LtrA
MDGGIPWRVPMSGRDPSEAHRAATPLELLFDLCFVVAVAQAANALHHALAGGEIAYGVAAYLIVFFGVWWPWVNFTWFASAYDTDDVPYRLLTFVQIAGVLVVAAGVPRAFEELDYSITVAGYVIMRTALVAQWLRAAREDPVGRSVALRFAVGIGVIQLLWVVRLAIGPPLGLALILVFGTVEMLIPWWAERSGRHTPWHPGHIGERYGLFTLIVLGECILAATTAIQAAFQAAGAPIALIAISVGGLLLVFAMWWMYFKLPAMIGRLTELRWQIAWGYGHFWIFAAVAALGAGLQVAADAVANPLEIPALTSAMAVAVPAAVYVAAIGVLHRRGRPWREVWSLGATAVAALAIAAAVGVPVVVLAIGLLTAGVVGWHAVATSRPAGARSGAENARADDSPRAEESLP